MRKHQQAPPPWFTPQLGTVLALLGRADGDHLIIRLLPHELEIESTVGDDWNYQIKLPLVELLQAVMKDTRTHES